MMNKAFVISGGLVVVIASFILYAGLTKDALVTSDEIFGAKFQGKDLIVVPYMRNALNNDEKANLSREIETVFAQQGEIKPLLNTLNATRLSADKQEKVGRFLELYTELNTVSRELPAEISSSAESADEKIALVVAQAVVLNELSDLMKEALKDTASEEASRIVNKKTIAFVNQVNSFKDLFFKAIQRDVINYEYEELFSEEMIRAFSDEPMNEAVISQFSQYDGRKFFEKIKAEKANLEAKYIITAQ